MSTPSLFDNALFLRFWRERMRPHIVGTSLTVVSLIIALIFIGNYMGRNANVFYDHSSQTSYPIPWLNSVLFQIAILQGVLLFIGVFSAGKLAGLEKSGGTFDFHRAAPETGVSRIIGMLLGAPILEWTLFFFTLPVSFIVMALSGIGVSASITCIGFYASLTLCALFGYALTVLAALGNKNRRNQAGTIFLLFYFFFHTIFLLSFLYHATPFPSYQDLYHTLIEQGIVIKGYRGFMFMDHLNLFWGSSLPTPFFHILVQVPLLGLFCLGIKRRFAFGEAPVWSKMQSAAFVGLICFFSAGSMHTVNSGRDSFNSIIFWYAALIVLLITVPMATPSQLMFIKGLHRARRLNVPSLPLHDDHSSNWLWIAAVSCLIAFTYICAALFYTGAFGIPQALSIAIGLCYIIFFSSILEYFNLSQYHQKKILLAAGLLILWVAFPIFGFILKSVAGVTGDALLQVFIAPSPFAGFWLVAEALTSNDPTPSGIKVYPLLFLLENALLAATAIALACREKARLRAAVRSER